MHGLGLDRWEERGRTLFGSGDRQRRRLRSCARHPIALGFLGCGGRGIARGGLSDAVRGKSGLQWARWQGTPGRRRLRSGQTTDSSKKNPPPTLAAKRGGERLKG